jgi:hypothetical protein
MAMRTNNIALQKLDLDLLPAHTKHPTDGVGLLEGIAVVELQIPVLVVILTAPLTAKELLDYSEYSPPTLPGSHSAHISAAKANRPMPKRMVTVRPMLIQMGLSTHHQLQVI